MKLTINKNMMLVAATLLCATAQAKVQEVTSAEELGKLQGPTIVRFYAEWCGACKATKDAYVTLSDDASVQGKVTFVAVDVDKAPALAQKHGVSGIPTFVYLKDGQVAYKAVGAPQDFVNSFKRTIEEKFNIAMKKSSGSMFAQMKDQIKKGFNVVSNKLQTMFGVA